MKKQLHRRLVCLMLLLPLLLLAACQVSPPADSAAPGTASVSEEASRPEGPPESEQTSPAPADRSDTVPSSGKTQQPEQPGGEPEEVLPASPDASDPLSQPEQPQCPGLPGSEPDQPPSASSDGSDASPPAEQTQPPEQPSDPEQTQPCVEEPVQEPPSEPVPDDPPPEPLSTLYILMYHDVVEGDGSGCNNWTVTTDRLREDLQWMTDQGFTFYLPRELAQGTPLAEKSVMITFDDGYASNYTLAFPLLKEFGAKAVISPIVGKIQAGDPGFLTWDMCREMADSGLVEFGSHTYDSHREQPRGIQRMPEESQAEYEARMFPDLQNSIDLLEEQLGREVCFFAYPHGQTEPWADSFLADRFSVTVTTAHGPADLSGGLYNLPRHNVTNQDKASLWLS